MKSALATFALALGLMTVSTSPAFAKGDFKRKHPRRAEVVGRANNEEKKNNEEAKEGEITGAQASRLNKQDERIKRQEERQAKRHGGHITKKEEALDNREENRVNKERENMEKRDATKTAPAAPAAGNDGP